MVLARGAEKWGGLDGRRGDELVLFEVFPQRGAEAALGEVRPPVLPESARKSRRETSRTCGPAGAVAEQSRETAMGSSSDEPPDRLESKRGWSSWSKPF
jgi:hypothetical protein